MRLESTYLSYIVIKLHSWDANQNFNKLKCPFLNTKQTVFHSWRAEHPFKRDHIYVLDTIEGKETHKDTS